MQVTSESDGAVGEGFGKEIMEEQMEYTLCDPMPLNFMFPDKSNISDWVLHMVKDIQQVVGLKCEGYEEQFWALLTTIKVRHQQQRKVGSKKQCELNRLTWSMNLEGSSIRDRSKGKGLVYPK